jgi:hypothetical protein
MGFNKDGIADLGPGVQEATAKQAAMIRKNRERATACEAMAFDPETMTFQIMHKARLAIGEPDVVTVPVEVLLVQMGFVMTAVLPALIQEKRMMVAGKSS